MPLKILSFILSLLEQVFPESWAAPYKTVRLHRYVKKRQTNQPNSMFTVPMIALIPVTTSWEQTLVFTGG